MTIQIPYPSTKAGRSEWSKKFGLNAIYAGKHFRARQSDSRYWHTLIAAELKKQGIQKAPASTPVSIAFFWNDRLDLDNHAYMRKMIIDGLKGWVIVDDDTRYVKSISECWHCKDYIKIVVSKTEAVV